MVMDIIQNYKTNASSSREERLQEAWDYVQAQVRTAGGDTGLHTCSLISAQSGCVVMLPLGMGHKCSWPPSTASETAPGLTGLTLVCWLWKAGPFWCHRISEACLCLLSGTDPVAPTPGGSSLSVRIPDTCPRGRVEGGGRQPGVHLPCACLERPLLAAEDPSLCVLDGPEDVKMYTSPSHLIPKGTHR